MRLPSVVFLGLLAWSSNFAHAVESHWDQDTLNKSLRQEAIAGVIPRIEQLIKVGADINPFYLDRFTLKINYVPMPTQNLTPEQSKVIPQKNYLVSIFILQKKLALTSPKVITLQV